MLSNLKVPQEINYKKHKLNLVSNKIGIILPELMARNSKLGDRLKSKLKVSNFLNSTEARSQKYLKSFVSSSEKRVKDLKTGLELLKAIKQSKKSLSPICSQISNDLIFKNSDFLIKEKKLLNENTEQETHIKINDLLQNIKNIIKNMNLNKKKHNKKIIKSLSEPELKNIKTILDDNIQKEGDMINYKIEGYLDKLKNKAETDRREYKNYAEHMNIFNNLNFINYIKPKPLKIKDKECSNMSKIKKKIFPYNNSFNYKNNKQNKKIKNEKIKYIYLENDLYKNEKLLTNININKAKTIEENNKNLNIEKDSLKLLNNLANQGKNLPLKINKSINKVNSLIDINLPNPTTYEMIIKKNKENTLNSDNNKINKNNIFEILKRYNLSNTHILSKNKLENIINSFSNEIDKIKNEQIDFDKNSNENNKTKNIIINPINLHLDRIKKYIQRNESNDNIGISQNLSGEILMKKKLQRYNSNNNLYNNSGTNSNLFSKLKNYDSSYLTCLNKYKILKNKGNNSYSNDSNFSILSKNINSKGKEKKE